MKLEEIIKNVSNNYETKLKQVNQLIDSLEKAKAELQQLSGALQLAQEMKQIEEAEIKELTAKEENIKEEVKVKVE